MSKEILENIPYDKKFKIYLKHHTFINLYPHETEIEIMDSFVKIFGFTAEFRVPYDEIAYIEIKAGDED